MDLVHALLLSVVEGVSEFLPISSTGHMVLAAELLKIQETEFVKTFEIFIQLGAILAIVVLYWRTFLTNTKVWTRVIAAFIPTGIIGLVLYKIVKNYLLGNDWVTVIALGVGGLVLIVLELLYKEKESHVSSIEEMTIPQAVGVGLVQSLSIVPGVSRSAATIIGGLFLGLKRDTAVKFSFLLAVPTMIAASGLDLVKTHLKFDSSEMMALAVGFIGAFVVALIVVRWFLGYVQKNNFIPFGVYRIIAALLFWWIILNK